MERTGLQGIIIRVYGRDQFTYTIHDGTGTTEFVGREFFQPGESVKALCRGEERLGKSVLVAEKIEKVADMYQQIEAHLEKRAEIVPPKLPPELERMLPDFLRIARRIYAAQQLGRFITVKFHGDADGISSALILRKFLKAGYVQQNSAIYSAGDAARDVERMGQHFRPLLIITDFGSGEDSADGLALATAGGIEILSIDHHPPFPRSASCFAIAINPWNLGMEDGSSYPAGYICSLLAPCFGAQSDGLERIACAGDKSTIFPTTKEEKDKALVLDFAATYSGFGNGMDFYGELLSKKELFDSILMQANAKLKETDRMLKTVIKSRPFPHITAYWFNLDGISQKKEFPNRGKITGRVFDLVNSEKPVAVIGISRRTLIFRFNDAAVSRGITANDMIRRMKTSFSDFVENGGGHSRAAALRINEGFENAALEEIIKMIGAS